MKFTDFKFARFMKNVCRLSRYRALSNRMTITVLVTGGAGYIGTHTCFELVESGHNVIILDNFINSDPLAVESLRSLVSDPAKVTLEQGDLNDIAVVRSVFKKYSIDSVMHLAGLKAVGESVTLPLMYYNNNITGTLNLLEVMREVECFKIIFSSSATVYGVPKTVPITEDFPLSATNPYGRTKLFIEQILGDLYVSDKRWSVYLLRYFNPIGAHASGHLGEDPAGIPNNLMPYISQVAIGKLPFLQVFGDDYDTPDGTGVRDYIHVVDLARGHVAALEKGLCKKPTGCYTYNLGTGRGYSVLELLAGMSKASGKSLDHKVVPRRVGDVATCYADSSKALYELEWKAEKSIEDGCADSWRWQSQHPTGFRASP